MNQRFVLFTIFALGPCLATASRLGLFRVETTSNNRPVRAKTHTEFGWTKTATYSALKMDAQSAFRELLYMSDMSMSMSMSMTTAVPVNTAAPVTPQLNATATPVTTPTPTSPTPVTIPSPTTPSPAPTQHVLPPLAPTAAPTTANDGSAVRGVSGNTGGDGDSLTRGQKALIPVVIVAFAAVAAALVARKMNQNRSAASSQGSVDDSGLAEP